MVGGYCRLEVKYRTMMASAKGPFPYHNCVIMWATTLGCVFYFLMGPDDVFWSFPNALSKEHFRSGRSFARPNQ